MEERRQVSVEVTNPKHYAARDDIIEVIDSSRSIGFNLGNARKYISRLGLKGGDNTAKRDSGSTIWYCLDYMAWLFETEEGRFVPTVEFYSDLDTASYIKQLSAWASAYESEMGLMFTGDYSPKRTALAALTRVIIDENNFVQTGTSDQGYADHVNNIFIACALAIHYCKPNLGMPTEPHGHGSVTNHDLLGTLYKGSRSFTPSVETFSYMAEFFDLMHKLHLHNATDIETYETTLSLFKDNAGVKLPDGVLINT